MPSAQVFAPPAEPPVVGHAAPLAVTVPAAASLVPPSGAPLAVVVKPTATRGGRPAVAGTTPFGVPSLAVPVIGTRRVVSAEVPTLPAAAASMMLTVTPAPLETAATAPCAPLRLRRLAPPLTLEDAERMAAALPPRLPTALLRRSPLQFEKKRNFLWENTRRRAASAGADTAAPLSLLAHAFSQYTGPRPASPEVGGRVSVAGPLVATNPRASSASRTPLPPPS